MLVINYINIATNGLFMSDALQKVIDTVDRTQVDFVDMRAYTSDELTIMVRNGKAEDVSTDKLEGVAIRALVNGAWGFASVGGFDPTDIKDTLNSAVKMARGMSTQIKRPAQMSDEYVFEATNEFKPDVDPQELSFEEKLTLAQKAERIIGDYDDHIINSISRFTEKVQREEIVNTNGTNVTTDYGIFRLSGAATARKGDVIQNVSDSVATSSGLKRILDWDIEEKMTNIAQRGVKLLDAAPSDP